MKLHYKKQLTLTPRSFTWSEQSKKILKGITHAFYLVEIRHPLRDVHYGILRKKRELIERIDDEIRT